MRTQHKQTNVKDILAKSQDWIAGILAGLVVFFGIPLFVEATTPFVEQFTLDHYGSGMVGIAAIIWWGIGAVGLYFISNIIALSLIRVATAKFFTRLFK